MVNFLTLSEEGFPVTEIFLGQHIVDILDGYVVQVDALLLDHSSGLTLGRCELGLTKEIQKRKSVAGKAVCVGVEPEVKTRV